MDEPKQHSEQQHAANHRFVASYGLLYLIRAHNRKEITTEQWLRLSKAWAEQMLRQYGKQE